MSELQLNENNLVSRIYFIRGLYVMLDFELAQLYGVETKQLKRAVRRNLKRFPEDFMFELTKTEWDTLRYQNGTSKWGGIRYMPFVFTEQGVAMLSGILNSDLAIEVNISIMRTFVKMRQLLIAKDELETKIKLLQEQTQAAFQEQQEQIQEIFEKLDELIKEKNEPRNPIGFKLNNTAQQQENI